ncbi:MAG TPA: class I SAM-dependent methyltransferase [Acidimicrobiales bacterium]|nr:class I SAM-dependent methyltransferase [Acidimicrobiales bacterium]
MTAAWAWPDIVFESSSGIDVHLLSTSGTTVLLDPSRWHAEPSHADLAVLDRAEDPILDIGCGPGRHAAELTGAGRDALGIDSSGAAVRVARRRGADAIQTCVFDAVPRTGEWATILLLDGNIGIGGAPGDLLRRCAELLRPGGRVLAEILAPDSTGRGERVKVVVRAAGGTASGVAGEHLATPWFEWATVSASHIGELARRVGFSVADVWCREGRWFAELRLEDYSDPPAPPAVNAES